MHNKRFLRSNRGLRSALALLLLLLILLLLPLILHVSRYFLR